MLQWTSVLKYLPYSLYMYFACPQEPSSQILCITCGHSLISDGHLNWTHCFYSKIPVSNICAVIPMRFTFSFHFAFFPLYQPSSTADRRRSPPLFDIIFSQWFSKGNFNLYQLVTSSILGGSIVSYYYTVINFWRNSSALVFCMALWLIQKFWIISHSGQVKHKWVLKLQGQRNR